jgi:2'-5' RNA ligase
MQGEFDFGERLPWRPSKPERLIFMLMPSAEVATRTGFFAQRFISDNRLPGRPLLTERLHVSVHHVGDYRRLRSRNVYAALLAGAAVSMSPFEVTARFIRTFQGAPARDGRPPKRPLVLLCEGDGLFELHGQVGAGMRGVGLRAADGFVPHMTLLYGPQAVPMQAIEPIRFMAEELVLIHSERGLTRYTALWRWPFQRRIMKGPTIH